MKLTEKLVKPVCLAFTLALVVTLGCDNPETTTPTALSTDSATTPAQSKVILCGMCGEETGSDSCCADGAEKCDSCGLHKGTALCCKVPEDMKGKDMCMSCGNAAGSEQCCAEGAEECGKCGLHKGSALCCKIEAEAETQDAPAEGETDETPAEEGTEAEASSEGE